MEEAKSKNLFDLSHTIASDLLLSRDYPWEILKEIKQFILDYGKTLSDEEYYHPSDDVWIAKTAKVAPSASISGPCIICDSAEIRQCAFIRGSAIVGCRSVIGNSTELKNCIIFDDVQVPHFNYVGDSVLGWHSHMGAGAVTSNVKSDRSNVWIRSRDEEIRTGIKKIGAMLGDYVEVGCNSVLNPGTVIGKNTNVYPLSSVRGVIPPDSIYKGERGTVRKR